MYLTKSLYWFTWDCIFILERLLAWCQESSLLPSLPWNTTHRCKGSWQLPGCPARSPSSPTTWSCCPSPNRTCSSMSSPLTRRYPKSWKGAVSAPAPHRGGYGGEWGTLGDAFLTHDHFGGVRFLSLNKPARMMGGLWCKLNLLRESHRESPQPCKGGREPPWMGRSSPSAQGAARSLQTQRLNWEPLPGGTVHQATLEKDWGFTQPWDNAGWPYCAGGLGQARRPRWGVCSPKVQPKGLSSAGLGRFPHTFWSSCAGGVQRTCLGQKSNFLDTFFFPKSMREGGRFDLLSVFLTWIKGHKHILSWNMTVWEG